MKKRSLNKDKNVTIVMVTHDDYISKYADSVVHMKDGVLLKS